MAKNKTANSGAVGGAVGGATGVAAAAPKPKRPRIDKDWNPQRKRRVRQRYRADQRAWRDGQNPLAPEDPGGGAAGGGAGGEPLGGYDPFDGSHTSDELNLGNEDPRAWARAQLAKQGLNFDPNMAFGDWMEDQLGALEDDWAAAQTINHQLSFPSFLETLGLGTGPTRLADFFRHRWAAALPEQTGYSASENGAGPTRWSVW